MGLADFLQALAGIWPPTPTFTPEHYAEMAGKVVLVTGANSGVGFEVAKLLVSKNAKVYALARNETSMEEGIEKIKAEFPNADIHVIKADLSDLTTIKPAVEKFLAVESQLDIVIHNAGVMLPPLGSVSAQDYELQLAVNNLAPYLLQKLLTPLMEKTASQLTGDQNTSRIVWVASSAQYFSPPAGVRINNLNDATVDIFENYGQSKAGDIILSNQWSLSNPNSKIISLSVDPGILKTNLARHINPIIMMFSQWLLYPAEKGAHSELFAALSPEITTKDNGRFVIPWGRFGLIRGDVKETCTNDIGKKFWDYCEEQTSAYN